MRTHLNIIDGEGVTKKLPLFSSKANSGIRVVVRTPQSTDAVALDGSDQPLGHVIAPDPVVLWQELRKGQLARMRFRRQHPVGPYILDFYFPAARLAVEVDGAAHDAAAQVRHDERRQAWLKERRITVLRFRASDVLRDETLEGVLQAIEEAAALAPSVALRAPPPP